MFPHICHALPNADGYQHGREERVFVVIRAIFFKDALYVCEFLLDYFGSILECILMIILFVQSREIEVSAQLPFK